MPLESSSTAEQTAKRRIAPRPPRAKRIVVYPDPTDLWDDEVTRPAIPRALKSGTQETKRVDL